MSAISVDLVLHKFWRLNRFWQPLPSSSSSKSRFNRGRKLFSINRVWRRRHEKTEGRFCKKITSPILWFYNCKCSFTRTGATTLYITTLGIMTLIITRVFKVGFFVARSTNDTLKLCIMILSIMTLSIVCLIVTPSITESMDKLQLTGQNLGRVFNSRSDCMSALHLFCYEAKQPNLKLKTRPKQLLGSILLVFMLPAETQQK